MDLEFEWILYRRVLRKCIECSDREKSNTVVIGHFINQVWLRHRKRIIRIEAPEVRCEAKRSHRHESALNTQCLTSINHNSRVGLEESRYITVGLESVDNVHYI